jgi:methionine-gamma-lyase
MRVHADYASRVASHLESHPAIKRVIYPGLPSHPQYELAQRQMSNTSGILTFQTRENGAEVARRLYRKLQVFTYVVSLGKQRSLLFISPRKTFWKVQFR